MKFAGIGVAAILICGLTPANAKSDCQTMQRLAQEMRMTWRAVIILIMRDLQVAQKEALEPKMLLTVIQVRR
jgi:hypothetical protein